MKKYSISLTYYLSLFSLIISFSAFAGKHQATVAQILKQGTADREIAAAMKAFCSVEPDKVPADLQAICTSKRAGLPPAFAGASNKAKRQEVIQFLKENVSSLQDREETSFLHTFFTITTNNWLTSLSKHGAETVHFNHLSDLTSLDEQLSAYFTDYKRLKKAALVAETEAKEGTALGAANASGSGSAPNLPAAPSSPKKLKISFAEYDPDDPVGKHAQALRIALKGELGESAVFLEPGAEGDADVFITPFRVSGSRIEVEGAASANELKGRHIHIYFYQSYVRPAYPPQNWTDARMELQGNGISAYWMHFNDGKFNLLDKQNKQSIEELVRFIHTPPPQEPDIWSIPAGAVCKCPSFASSTAANSSDAAAAGPSEARPKLKVRLLLTLNRMDPAVPHMISTYKKLQEDLSSRATFLASDDDAEADVVVSSIRTSQRLDPEMDEAIAQKAKGKRYVIIYFFQDYTKEKKGPVFWEDIGIFHKLFSPHWLHFADDKFNLNNRENKRNFAEIVEAILPSQ